MLVSVCRPRPVRIAGRTMSAAIRSGGLRQCGFVLVLTVMTITDTTCGKKEIVCRGQLHSSRANPQVSYGRRK